MRVRNLSAAFAVSVAAASASPAALADCAQGDWFCGEPERPPNEPERKDAATPPPSAEPAETLRTPRAVSELPPAPKAKPSAKPAPSKRYGVNGHANFAFSGNDPDLEPSSMEGAGAAFRLRPTKRIGLDSGLDLVGGRDWNGDDRLELAGLVHALVFLNPHERLELHALVGGGVSIASVREEQPDGSEPLRHYVYVGWDGGFGLEWFVTKRVTLGVEALAFLRVRDDDDGERPEFSDPRTHRATSLSVGALIRPGVTFYW